MASTFNNILIIGHRNIGDVLHNMALLKPLKKQYPKTNISMLTSPAGVSLLKGNPYLLDAIPFQKKKGLKGLKARLMLIQKLQKKKYDLIINIKSGSFFPYFLGFQPKWHICKKDKSLKIKRTKHAIDIYLDTIRTHGIKATKEDLDMKVYVTPDEKKHMRKRLVEMGYRLENPIIVIAPFSNWHAKEWPLNHYLQLSEMLITKYRAQVIFIGGLGDIPKANNNLPLNVMNLVGKTSLRELAALYEFTTFAIGADSGPFHLAVNQGTPALAIFGPTSHYRARPYFTPENTVHCTKDLGCNPCIPGKNYMACKVFDTTTPCMAAIPYEIVSNETNLLLNSFLS